MSTSKLLAALFGVSAAAVVLAESPQLGEPVEAADIAKADLTVLPDGEGLPDGSGTAHHGAELYARLCIACHGEEGQGGLNDRLAGGHGTLTAAQPVKTVGSYWPYATTIFDYVRRAMPYTAPGTLSSDEIYALTAYLLFINGIVDEDAVMDADTLPDVQMPNRDNFEWAYSPSD